MKTQQPKTNSANRRPPSRLNSLNSGQTTTVRINPLIFKQQQNSQPFQLNYIKQKQSFIPKKQTNLLSQSSILINNNINSDTNSNHFTDFRQNNFLASNDAHHMIDFPK